MGDRGFKNADSRNSPHVNSEMVHEFLSNGSHFNVKELRAVKTHKWVYFNS